MNDIIKSMNSLDDSSELIDRVTETVKHGIKKIRKQISWSFVSAFSRFNRGTHDFFSSKSYK